MIKKEMPGKGIKVFDLKNNGDDRGFSYNVPRSTFDFIGEINETHVATIVPGATRGNHYHVDRKEFILVWFNDLWILAWDQGGGTGVETQVFHGVGLKLIEIDTETSHAIKNIGMKDILIMAFSNKKYKIEEPDTYKRVVI